MTKKKDLKYYLNKKYDNMMGRCYRKTDLSYKNYGEKGIKVCKEWIIDINNFRQWFMSELNKNGISETEFLNKTNYYQLDRHDVTGHYTPKNCRIVNPQLNSRNKKHFKDLIISAEGEEIYLK